MKKDKEKDRTTIRKTGGRKNLRPVFFFSVKARATIFPEDTLIIFDEIQACERALTSLKYFYEKAPQYHIIAAGSLLGVALNRQSSSYPVGKVDRMTLYPLDFEEFLWANQQRKTINFNTA